MTSRNLNSEECKKFLIKTSEAIWMSMWWAADRTRFICVANVYFRQSWEGNPLWKFAIRVCKMNLEFYALEHTIGFILSYGATFWVFEYLHILCRLCIIAQLHSRIRAFRGNVIITCATLVAGIFRLFETTLKEN